MKSKRRWAHTNIHNISDSVLLQITNFCWAWKLRTFRLPKLPGYCIFSQRKLEFILYIPFEFNKLHLKVHIFNLNILLFINLFSLQSPLVNVLWPSWLYILIALFAISIHLFQWHTFPTYVRKTLWSVLSSSPPINAYNSIYTMNCISLAHRTCHV